MVGRVVWLVNNELESMHIHTVHVVPLSVALCSSESNDSEKIVYRKVVSFSKKLSKNCQLCCYAHGSSPSQFIFLYYFSGKTSTVSKIGETPN